jgi:glycosyltransferase involved in cell wall biosynthesis
MMDVMVVPSIREPLGNTIIESGYCKKPVIASNIDGIAEIVVNKVSGILIDPENNLSFESLPKDAVTVPKVVVNPKTLELQKPKEIDPIKLSESIVQLETNPKLRKKYGENLYMTVKQKFCIENYFKNLEKIYHEILLN